MTPSHHRVHHDRRVHKNFGGFLILWDRIFGSFQDEYETVRPLREQIQKSQKSDVALPQEEVTLFGALNKVDSWTEPVTQIQFWSPMTRAFSLGSFFKAAWIGPGFYTTGSKRDIKAPSASAIRIRKKSELPLLGKVYVVSTFLGVAVAIGFIVMLFSSPPWTLRALGGLITLSALYCQGLLLDADERHGLNSEIIRCLGCVVICALLQQYGAGRLQVNVSPAVSPSVSKLTIATQHQEILAYAFMQQFLMIMAGIHTACLCMLLGSPASFLAPGFKND